MSKDRLRRSKASKFVVSTLLASSVAAFPAVANAQSSVPVGSSSSLAPSISAPSGTSNPLSNVDNETAVDMLEENLQKAAAEGDSEAAVDLQKVTSFNEADRAQLGEALRSDDALKAIQGESPEDNPSITVEQTYSMGKPTAEDQASLEAWHGWDWAEGCMTAGFLGVQVTEICTGGSYYTNNGLVTQTTNARSVVKRNLYPGADVSTYNTRSNSVGGAALFQAEIRVDHFTIGNIGQLDTRMGTHAVLIRPFPNGVLHQTVY